MKKWFTKLIAISIFMPTLLSTTILHGKRNTVYAEVTFTPTSSVFNRDLLTSANEPIVWKHLLVASVSGLGTATWNQGLGTTDSSGTAVPAKVEVTSEYGDTLVSGGGIGTIVKSADWSRTNAADILGQSAADAGAVPLVVEWQDAVDPDQFRLGVNTIKISSEGGPTYTTTLTVVQNEWHSRQTWTQDSEGGLVIAHMPNLTQALLEDIITDVVVSKDGVKYLTDFNATGILEVDEATGAVSIRKERLSSLELGEYMIRFNLPHNGESTIDHRLSFTVAAAPSPTVHSIKTGDHITEMTIASLGAISLLTLGVMLTFIKKKKHEV